jgi:hypothetical protein
MPYENDCLKAMDQAIREHYLRPAGDAAAQPRRVIGVGIAGKDPDGLSLRFYVQSGSTPAPIPDVYYNTPTTVIETRRFVSFASSTYRVRAAPGATISLDSKQPNIDSNALGTLGAVVDFGNRRYILGSNHVMAVNGRVAEGTRIIYRPPDRFIDDPRKYILARVKAYVPLVPGDDKRNQVDCALAEVEQADRDKVIAEFPRKLVKYSDIVPPLRGMKVGRVDEKDSATGVIEDTHLRVRIDYRFGTFDFENMMLIKGDQGQFAKPGDSGALVFDTATNRATAIVVGGSQEYTIACPLQKCLDQLRPLLSDGQPVSRTSRSNAPGGVGELKLAVE